MSDRYDEACREATTRQGLDPVIAALAAARIPHAVEQTGGFTMVVTIPSRQPSNPGTWAIICDVVYLLGFYAGTTWEDGEGDEAIYSQFVGLEALIERIRRGPRAPLGWRVMFPGYEVPAEIERIEDLRDASDPRGACPCFADDYEIVKLWVDHPDSTKRDGERFAVTYWGEDGNTPAYEGDDVHEALRVYRTTFYRLKEGS
jgi:hypothetical protein